jgi:hypothetical protein
VARIALEAAHETARAKQASAADQASSDLGLNDLRQMLRKFGISSSATSQRYT